MRDAAEDEFGYTEDQDAYTKTLMSRIHLGGTYQVYTGNNSGGKVGVLLQTEIYNKSFRPSLTLSYNQSVGRWMEAALSYSMINRGYNNLGLGLSLNLGPLQVYAAMDNVFAARLTTFQRNDNNQQVTVFSYPTNSHKTHVHFGINFTFGRKKKSNSVEDVIEEILGDEAQFLGKNMPFIKNR